MDQVEVLTGVWTNYGRGGVLQLLLTNFHALLLALVLGAVLPLSGRYVVKILRSLWHQLVEWYQEGSEASNNPSDPSSHPLLPVEPSEQAGNVQEPHNLQSNNRQQGVATITVSILIFVVFVGFAALAASSSAITTDRIARLASEHCGIWRYDESTNEDDAARADLNDFRAEARAGEYAQHCYDNRTFSDTSSCSILYTSHIPFSTKSEDECPFSSVELCAGGKYSAVTFDTGLVNANTIGINTQSPYKFRRISTCSPLSMDYPYIRNATSGGLISYYYHYGHTQHEGERHSAPMNLTFRSSGDPFNWLAPVYSVRTYATSLYPNFDYWTPIPDLIPKSNDSTLTILFITSMHIFYLRRGEDPIFPATKRHYFDGNPQPYYSNSDPRARPFACVDKTELCSPDGRICWPMNASPPDGVTVSPAYWLMKWSLSFSTTYDSIAWRLGTALLAQQKVGQSRSLPLESNHWESEARRLFETSLARIQLDAWGIAIGENKDEPGYIEVTPGVGRGKLCDMFVLNSNSHVNVNVGLFFGLLSIPLIFFLLSLEIHTITALSSNIWACMKWCYYRGRLPLVTSPVWDRVRRDWEPLVANLLLSCILWPIIMLCRGIYYVCGCVG